jgi:hypothetical protein
MRRSAFLLLALVVLPALASAHPPYEHVAAVVPGPGGEPLSLVRSYVDGIVVSDPVKMVVQDKAGVVLDETAYVRDISMSCARADRCLLFLFDGPTPVFPIRILRLSGTRFVQVRDTRLQWLGLVVHLQNHWFGYLQAVAFFLLPFAALRITWRRSRGRMRVFLCVVVAVGGVFVLLSWLWVMSMLTETSLPIALLLVAFVVAADRLTAAVGSRWSLRRARGPTRAWSCRNQSLL